MGCRPQGITVIHNSLVFRAAASPERNEELRAKWGAGADTTVLLCVAMFRPGKNQEELVELAAGLPAGFDFQLWLAGEARPSSSCMRRVDEHSLGAKVKFLGWQRDPTPLYAAADIAVHASRTESFRIS